MDTCGQPGRAYSSLFTLLSAAREAARDQPVAALVLDEAAPTMVTPLLDMQAIPQLKDPAERRDQDDQTHVVGAWPECLGTS